MVASAASARAAAQPSAPYVSPAPDGQWEGEAKPKAGWPLFLLLHLDRHPDGLKATLFVLGQTVDLGGVAVEGRRMRVSAGEGREALTIDASVRGGRLVGTLSQNGDVLPFALDRIPAYPKPANRLQSWAQDLDAMATRVPKADRSFSPAARTAFARAIAGIKRDLPRLSDQRVMVRMAAAMALARNAHTRLYLVRVRTQVRMLPIRLWWFKDGLRVVRTAPEYRALLGCRVADIEGVDARRARALVAPAYAGNAGWIDYMSTYTLSSSDMLAGFGIIASPERAVFGLTDCPAPAPARVKVNALPLVRSNTAVEAWWDLAPGMGDPSWVQVLAERHVPVPLYLRHPDLHYWHEYLPESATLYVQYNRASDMPGESTAAYAKRLLAEFDSRKIKALVFDLRFNTGGNGDLARDLMRALIARTQGMRRFVITSRATFSAGISHAAKWRELPDVKFVGELVGDNMDFWSEGGNILLPNSGLAAHFANGPHSYSTAPCPRRVYCVEGSAPSLRPDMPASPTWQQYVEGDDPSMDAILRS